MHTLTAELLRREVRVLVVGCGGNGTAVNFFGIRDISTSVVIMIDVSD